MKFQVGQEVRVKRDVRPYPRKVGTVVDAVRATTSEGWFWTYGIHFKDVNGKASTPHEKWYRENELSLA